MENRGHLRLGGLLVLFLTLFADSALAKKDFKGLFGNYRREKFTENPGNSTDFGMDLMLSTLIPLSPIVSSTEDRSVGLSTMPQATFFNVEGSFFFSLAYNFELYANIGYYNYETRKENTQRNDPALPLFHQFEMQAIPLVLGVRYRFSADDIVPYVGIGVGGARVTRKGYYDYNSTNFDEETSTVLTAHAAVGIEFYFSSSAGIRLETSAYYFRLPERTFDPSAPSGNAALLPIISYAGNPVMLRYASGLFYIF